MTTVQAISSRPVARPHRVPSRYAGIATSLGEFRFYEMADGSLRSSWKRDAMNDPALAGAKSDPDMQPNLVRALQRYFANSGKASFDAAETPEGPEFFRRCWEACRAIPRGETRSYAWLAKRAGGDSGAARAAGQAMRRNPLPVIIPCHRVVASDGRLHGFAGRTSGSPLDLKRSLLELEGAVIA